jgi:ribonucleotide reductase alpha subunit
LKVEKRDKRIVEFDDSKIEAAITKAFESINADTGPVRGLTKEVVQIIHEKNCEIIHIEEIQDIVEDTLMLRGFTEIARRYMKYREKHNEARKILQMMGVVDDLKFGPNAATVLSRYLLKDEDGNPTETPSQLFRRVSGAVASIEKKHDENADVKEYDDLFYYMMANLEFLPNSPTLFNAGTEIGQCSACFVLPIEDNMDSIFTSLKHMAVVQKSGGGTGFSFSRLRPVGSTVGTTGGVASGPISFMRVYDTATEIIKQGGCLSTETFVQSTKGLRKLNSLINGRLAVETPLNELVLTRNNYKQALISANNGFTEITRIQTELGYSLDATYNHKIRVCTPEGIQWKKTKDLVFGDWVVIKRGGYQGTDLDLSTTPSQHHNATPLHLPKKMDSHLAEVIGYFIGDGCLSFLNKKKARMVFSVTHDSPDIAEWIEDFFEGLGLIPYKEQKKNDASWTIGGRSVTLGEWWIKSGFDKESSVNARVPEIIFTSSIETVRAFLRGLYEADGDVSTYGYPRLSSASEQLIIQVQQLLLSIGIVSRRFVITKRTSAYGSNPIHTLIITHRPSVLLFSGLIGFKSKSKSERFKKKIERVSGKASDPIPFAGDLIARYYSSPGRGSGKNREQRSANPKLNRELTRYIRGERNPHRMRILEIAQLMPGLQSLLNDEVLREDFVYTRITNLTTHEMDTGDIEVIGSEYVANGFLVHNRRRGANMAILRCDHPDIMEFISCKSDKQSFRNFNISIALTEKFIDALQNNEDVELVAPNNGEVTQSISARVVFDAIVHNAWSTGDPGIIFIDRINDEHPLGGELIESTNPCVAGNTLVSTDAGLLNIQDVPSVIKTAKKLVYFLRTREGYQVKVTKDHRILTPKGWKQAGSLNEGDVICLQASEGGFGKTGNLRVGQILGWYVGDGWNTGTDRRATLAFYGNDKGRLAQYFCDIVNEELESGLVIIKSKKREEVRSRRILNLIQEWEMESKQISNLLLSSSADCQRGFLQGLFTADGSIQGKPEKGFSVRLSQNDLDNLHFIQIMLLNFGIASKIYENRRREKMRLLPDSKGQPKYYRTKANHELVISKENIVRFRDNIGFLLEYKQNRLVKGIDSLNARGPYRETFLARFESLKPLLEEDVFDIVGTPHGGFVGNGIVVHNCGEQPLLPYESCVLGSINLSRMVKDGEINWQRLEEVIRLAVRFLDNIIDLNVYPVREIEQVTKANRKIGLGIMGFAELLIKLGIPYDSEKGLEKAEEVMSFIRQRAERASSELAKIRGNFENFALLKKRNKWKRNASLITVAPTGSISLIAQTSSGIEPLFAIAHSRMLAEGIYLSEVSPVFEKVATERGFWSDAIESEVAKTGSVQHIDGVPEDVKQVFKAAQEIDPEWHIRMQAAFQKHTDNAVSKTVNLPNSATTEDIERIFMLANQLRLKGTTVFRDGCLGGVQVLYPGCQNCDS